MAFKCKHIGKDYKCLKMPTGYGGFEYCVQGPCEEIFNPTPRRKIKICMQAKALGLGDGFSCIRNFDNGEGCLTCSDLRDAIKDFERLGLNMIERATTSGEKICDACLGSYTRYA